MENKMNGNGNGNGHGPNGNGNGNGNGHAVSIVEPEWDAAGALPEMLSEVEIEPMRAANGNGARAGANGKKQFVVAPKPAERQTPSNVEAEQAVLGSCLLDEGAFFRVELEAEHFFIARHAAIWKAMQALAADGIPIDFLTVASKLTEQKKLDYVSGAAYLTSLLNAVPTAAHIEQYARLVKREWTRRKLLEASTQVAELVYASDELDDDELVTKAQGALFFAKASGGRALSWDEMWEQYQGRLDKFVTEKREFWGNSTGFPDIDKKVGGLEPQVLYVIAGDPGKGKTALAMQMALHNALDGHRVLVFSLEMGWQSLMDRFVADMADVPATDLKRGRISEFQLRELRERGARRAGLPLVVDARSSVTQQQIRAAAMRMRMEGASPELIVVDYSRYVKTTTRAARQDLIVADVFTDLKEIAKDFDVPVILIHEKNKTGGMNSDKGGDDPTLLMLKDGGTYQGDVVMMVGFKDRSRADYDPRDLSADIWVVKNKYGPTGHLDMLYDGEKTRWMCLAQGQRGAAAQEKFAKQIVASAPSYSAPAPPWEDEQ